MHTFVTEDRLQANEAQMTTLIEMLGKLTGD